MTLLAGACGSNDRPNALPDDELVISTTVISNAEIPGDTELSSRPSLPTGAAAAQLLETSPVAPGTLIRVEIEPCVGLGRQRATAMAVGPQLAITAAHSVEGAKAVTLRYTDSAGRETTVGALLEAADPGKDIALIRPAAPLELAWEPFSLGEPLVGDPVTVETYADADGPVTKPAEVLRLVNTTLDGEGRRAAVELMADIDPGDSGAPVLAPNGRTIGMIFASSRTSERGWAVRSNELAAVLDEHEASADAVAEGPAADGTEFACPDPVQP